MKQKYAYWDTLVAPVTKVTKISKIFSEVELEGFSGIVEVLTAHLFDSELEANKFGLSRAQERLWHFTRKVEELA